MENSMLSAASEPFVTRHAPETAFARDDLRNSWKLEFRLLEIALAATKIRRASRAKPRCLYFALSLASVERIEQGCLPPLLPPSFSRTHAFGTRLGTFIFACSRWAQYSFA